MRNTVCPLCTGDSYVHTKMNVLFQEKKLNQWSCLRKNSDEMSAKADVCGILERIPVRKAPEKVVTLEYQINEHVRLFFFRKKYGLCVLI